MKWSEAMRGKKIEEAEGSSGNRGGHNVNDNTFIFDIPAGQPGYASPRKDTPKPAGKKPGG